MANNADERKSSSKRSYSNEMDPNTSNLPKTTDKKKKIGASKWIRVEDDAPSTSSTPAATDSTSHLPKLYVSNLSGKWQWAWIKEPSSNNSQPQNLNRENAGGPTNNTRESVSGDGQMKIANPKYLQAFLEKNGKEKDAALQTLMEDFMKKIAALNREEKALDLDEYMSQRLD